LKGVKTAIAGGPAIIKDGKAFSLKDPPPGTEGNYSERSKYERHPRSAVGWSPTHVYLVTVDGRQPGVSEGFTLEEAARFMRSLGAVLKAAPRTYGWCRTRWSCATLAATLQAKHGIEVSAETVRRWLHEIGWVWKRAKLVAKDDDPHRIERLARIRFHHENLQAHEMMVFADELDIPLLPKVGAAWMPQGTPVEIMTPGKNEKHSLAGALHLTTGQVLYCLGPRKHNGLFRDLLTLLDATYPAPRITRIYVVVDNYCIHKAKAVEQWLASHPRFVLLWLPTYCPRANPIERVFGDVHDKCTRNHKRKRLRDVVQDVEQHVQVNGPWRYNLSQIYQAPEITAAVERLTAEAQAKIAA